MFAGQGRGGGAELLAGGLGVAAEVLEQDAALPEEAEETLGVSEPTFGAAEAQAVETGEDPQEQAGEALYKGLHDVAPWEEKWW